MDIKRLHSLTAEQYTALYDISKLLNSAVLSDALIARSLDLVINAIGAERGLFCRYENDSGRFSIITARNMEKKDIEDLSQFSSGVLQQVVDAKKPVLYHDVQSDSEVSQFKSLQIHQIKSIIGVPVVENETLWGVILADSREDRSGFTEENLTFLQFFANMAGLALEKILALEKLRDENEILRNRVESFAPLPDMIGTSASMRELSRLIHRVAQSDATVLLMGESGTGKDLVARAIHKLSPRRDKPFLAQFCGSIPDTLLESELFGYKKGAFSGAVADKKGLFEVASQGTFFLDEIADISMALQAKLLRVLQNQEIMRLGETQVRRVNVRIITATNQNLSKLVKKGDFRQDLYYRLNVFPVTLPPLRQCHGDIPLLVDYFIKKHKKELPEIDPAAMQRLESYHWPGNVRQLENVLQRALILCDDNHLQPEHIILESDEERQEAQFDGTLKSVQKQLLLQRLQKYSGNRTKTAQSLGVSVRWVQLQLKEMEEQSAKRS
ncbi:GAF domain-containing protein [candidate division KSB1 bacterium]|nr:GAF domain-containing protein [candidate division KSB1 bacterium]